MKKLILFCLLTAPLMITAAANNNNISDENRKIAQLYLFHGQKAFRTGDFDRAKDFFEKSANLGYQGGIEALANLPSMITERNQRQGPGKVIIEKK